MATKPLNACFASMLFNLESEITYFYFCFVYKALGKCLIPSKLRVIHINKFIYI